MNLLNNLSDEADQVVHPVLEDGSVTTIELVFRPTIQRWSYSFSHPNGFKVNGAMLCVHPNLFRSWRNVQSFGMACVSADGTDPVHISDFSSGRVQIYMLNATDVKQVETQIMGAFAA